MSNFTPVYSSMAGLSKDRVVAQTQAGVIYLGLISGIDTSTPQIYFRQMDIDIEPLVEQGK